MPTGPGSTVHGEAPAGSLEQHARDTQLTNFRQSIEVKVSPAFTKEVSNPTKETPVKDVQAIPIVKADPRKMLQVGKNISSDWQKSQLQQKQSDSNVKNTPIESMQFTMPMPQGTDSNEE